MPKLSMSKDERLTFIYEILFNARVELMKREQFMPEDWNGYELRQYILDYLSETLLFVHMDKQSGRWRKYKNELKINGRL